MSDDKTYCIFCFEDCSDLAHCDNQGKNPLCSRCNELRKIVKEFKLQVNPWKLVYKNTIEIKCK
jgi:hypothetical protein